MDGLLPSTFVVDEVLHELFDVESADVLLEDALELSLHAVEPADVLLEDAAGASPNFGRREPCRGSL